MIRVNGWGINSLTGRQNPGPRPRDGFYDFSGRQLWLDTNTAGFWPLEDWGSPRIYRRTCVCLSVFVGVTEGLCVSRRQRPKHMLISVSFLKVGMDIWIRLINLTVLKTPLQKECTLVAFTLDTPH